MNLAIYRNQGVLRKFRGLTWLHAKSMVRRTKYGTIEKAKESVGDAQPHRARVFLEMP